MRFRETINKEIEQLVIRIQACLAQVWDFEQQHQALTQEMILHQPELEHWVTELRSLERSEADITTAKLPPAIEAEQLEALASRNDALVAQIEECHRTYSAPYHARTEAIAKRHEELAFLQHELEQLLLLRESLPVFALALAHELVPGTMDEDQAVAWLTHHLLESAAMRELPAALEEAAVTATVAAQPDI
jgi:hypothetical protein